MKVLTSFKTLNEGDLVAWWEEGFPEVIDICEVTKKFCHYGLEDVAIEVTTIGGNMFGGENAGMLNESDLTDNDECVLIAHKISKEEIVAYMM